MTNHLLWLTLIWIIWCIPHSLLLWPPLRGRLEHCLGLSPDAYRGWYSVISLASIAPAVWYTWRLGGIWPFFWGGAWLYVQIPLWALAGFVLIWADRTFKKGGFDMIGFGSLTGDSKPGHKLIAGGPYAYCRNPMHLAGLVMLWARHLSAADVAVNVVMSAYIVLGTWLEEKRLAGEFGPEYETYRRQTPMLGWRISFRSRNGRGR